MLDLSNRMQDISTALNEPETAATEETSPPPTTDSITTATAPPPSITPTPLEDKERMLDELMEIVESIDQAKDLSTIGGLHTLLHLLSSPHASLRWRAAEVIATCVQNNPEVQDAFLQGGVLPALWPLLENHHHQGNDEQDILRDDTPNSFFSSHAVCLVKGMLAVSCQIRGHPASLQWFRENNGLKKLISILSNTSSSGGGGGGGGEAHAEAETRIQRKCLQMLEYVLNTVPSDRKSAVTINVDDTVTARTRTNTVDNAHIHECSGSLIPLLVKLISNSEDGDIRSGALGVIHQLAEDDACSVELQKESSGVVAAVQAVQCKLDSLPKEEWGPAEEEAKLAVVVMEGFMRKKGAERDIRSSGSGGGGGNAETSLSMQVMALPEQE
jgi:hsp70-interacting protein